MKVTTKLGLLGLLTVAFTGWMFSTTAGASTSALAYYELGEADTSAASHTPPNPGDGGGAITVDSSGHGFNLTESGTPTYSNNVAPGTGSTLSIAFTGTENYDHPAPITGAITNVVFDAWAYPTTTNAQGYIVFQGVGGSNGYGIFQDGNIWSFIEQNVGFNLASGPLAAVVPNQWVHLTLMLDNSGVLTGYINGTLVATNSASAAHTPTGDFFIGSGFVGNIDEVQVFIPEPASLGLLACGSLLMLRRRGA